jgi:hypothetical protein
MTDEPTSEGPKTPKRVLARRRRENVTGGRRHSHRVKVTPEEEARLVLRAAAQRVTVPRLLVESALADGGETPAQRREAIVQLFAMRRDLAGLATNMNQIARYANTIEAVPEDAYAAMVEVRELVARMDAVIDGLRV